MSAARRPVVLSWSGGKDSALALRALLSGGDFEVVGLLTTVTETTGRVALHEVPQELLQRQAEALGLPLRLVPIPPACVNAVYDERVGAALAELGARGVRHVAFGDLFLEDLRRWRDERLAAAGMAGVYPLWGRDTAALAREFVAAGFRAWVCSVDGRALDGSFAGRPLDGALLADLPPGADPCGENGEYHSFVYDGPIFRAPVRCRLGRSRRDERFHYRELLAD